MMSSATDRTAAEILFPHVYSLTVRLKSGKEVLLNREIMSPLPEEPFELIKLDFIGRTPPSNFTTTTLLPAIEKLPSLTGIATLLEGSFTTTELARLATSPCAANLTEFVVGLCELNGENLDLLKKFPKLERIGLRAANPTAELITRLKQEHPGMRSLLLRDFGMQAAPDESALTALSALPIEELNLSHRSLGLRDRKLCRAIAAIPNLKSLTIQVLELEDTSAAELGLCPKLEVLNLSFSGDTDALLPSLSSLTKLTDLNVFGTKITDEGAKVFAKTHPNCRIVAKGWGINPKR